MGRQLILELPHSDSTEARALAHHLMHFGIFVRRDRNAIAIVLCESTSDLEEEVPVRPRVFAVEALIPRSVRGQAEAKALLCTF